MNASIPHYRDPTLWYSALGSKYGIVVKTNDLRGAASRLYQSRKSACDPELDGLSLRPSPMAKDELLIVKNGKGS